MPPQPAPRYTGQLEAFRRLSEQIAHDMNNLLSSILGYSDLLLLDPAADQIKNQVKEISNAGKRIAALARLISAFGTKYRSQPAILDMNEVIQDMKRLLPHILGNRIDFIAVQNPGLWPVKADPAKMKQLLITLAVDMKSSLPEGGRLTLSLRNRTVGPSPGSQLEPERYVLVTASSSGSIAVDETSEGLRAVQSPSRGSSRAEEEHGWPSVSELAQAAGGSMLMENCSEQELTVSICLPAIPSQPLPLQIQG
ncbi:MAG: hypothetical protein JXA73_27050 [Acidobacteria bacterium]|nr:hypothetical protein [Acidobacteriota bacterium]